MSAPIPLPVTVRRLPTRGLGRIGLFAPDSRDALCVLAYDPDEKDAYARELAKAEQIAAALNATLTPNGTENEPIGPNYVPLKSVDNEPSG